MRPRGVDALVVAAAVLLAAPGAAQTPPPAELFGQLPAISQLQLSPDGRHLAVIQAVDGRLTPLIYRTDALHDPHPVVLPTADWTIDSFAWANSTRLVMVVRKNTRRQGETEIRTLLRAIAVNLDGSNPVVLLNKERGYTNNPFAADIVSIDLSDPDHAYAALYVPYVSTLPSKLGYLHPEKVSYHLNLFKVDVNTGAAVPVGRGEDGTSMWLMGANGRIAARVDQDRHPLVEHVFVNRDGGWNEIASFDAAGGNGADILGLTTDGKALVRFARLGPEPTRGLVGLAIDDGKTAVLFDDPAYDVNVPLAEPWTGRIIGVSVVADQEKYRYFDPQTQALQDGLEAAFPGAAVLLASWDVAMAKIVVQVNGAKAPPSFYLVDRATHQAESLGDTYPGLDAARLGDVKPYPYKARDGLDIHAYLTLPPGKPGKMLPAVILPHGGPGERDQMQFAWMAQFFATRGYAVLQPNFRGSTGYGERFRQAGNGQWGLKMQDDITDGVDKLIADGIVDRGRICIVGASYGGYAALAGAAFTPGLYACAAAWAPVTDARKFLAERAETYGRDSAPYSSWARSIGGDEVTARLDDTSPALHADRVRCPVLLMHGTLDVTVRIDQSRDMNDALVRAGKPVEFIEFPGESHFMEKTETRVRVLRELEKFLAEYIGR